MNAIKYFAFNALRRILQVIEMFTCLSTVESCGIHVYVCGSHLVKLISTFWINLCNYKLLLKINNKVDGLRRQTVDR